MGIDSQTAHLLDQATAEAAGVVEEEILETSKPLTVRYRLPPDGKQVVVKVFEMRTPGPNDRKAIALLSAAITGGAAWGSLPADYRAWVSAMARIGVMFKGQTDADWLTLRCERNAVLLDKVDGEVEAFWAESFPQTFVVGSGEESEVVAAVEVTSGGARPTPAAPARPPRRAGVTPVR